MSVSGGAFILAVVIFTVLMIALIPLVQRLAAQYADFLDGGSALIATALGLLLTAWISDGLSIDGAGTWLLATILVWLITAIIGVLAARLILRKYVVDQPT